MDCKLQVEAHGNPSLWEAIEKLSKSLRSGALVVFHPGDDQRISRVVLFLELNGVPEELGRWVIYLSGILRGPGAGSPKIAIHGMGFAGDPGTARVAWVEAVLIPASPVPAKRCKAYLVELAKRLSLQRGGAWFIPAG